MSTATRYLVLPLITVCSIVLAGCSQSTSETSHENHREHDHDHAEHNHGEHDHAEHEHDESLTFAAALQQTKQVQTDIQTAFAAKDLVKADGPVHRMGDLLHDLPRLASEAPLSDADQQQVRLSVDKLMRCFGAVDARLHGGENVGKSYEDVAAQVDEQFEKLRAVKLPESRP